MSSTTTDPTVVNVASGASQSGTYFAIIKIADTTKDATFNGTFSWALANI